MAVKLEPFGPRRKQEIRRELDAFEARYGVSSEQLATVFTRRGRLHETDDYRRWQFLWSVWQCLMRANQPLEKR